MKNFHEILKIIFEKKFINSRGKILIFLRKICVLLFYLFFYFFLLFLYEIQKNYEPNR